jgi:GNAT superfamily N-acetyltransferase
MLATFRTADNHDIAMVRHIVYSTLREYGLQPEPSGTDADVEDIDAHYGPAGSYLCIAEVNGQAIATGGLRRISGARCELRKMYMLSEFRGKGFGRQLLVHLVNRARESGYREISLETASVLKEAIALYERFGFIDRTDADMPARCDRAMILRL